jgi:hypothetical protein
MLARGTRTGLLPPHAPETRGGDLRVTHVSSVKPIFSVT